MQDLAARWRHLLGPWAPPRALDELYADLAARYGEPQRHYHTLRHVAAVLDCIDEIAPQSPPAVRLAAWFHDVIYDPRAGDNEARSADYARDRLAALGISPEIIDEAGRLILLTRTHDTGSDDADGCVLLDADLSILAAAPAEYDDYAVAIRREYDWVPETEYRSARRQILLRFLARAQIYLLPTMHPEREAAARSNLAREIAVLSS